MSEVVYTHNLEWKAFNVCLPTVQTWLTNNTLDFVGISADSSLKIHFTSVPTDEVKVAIDAYWDAITDDGAYAAEQAKIRQLLIEKTKIQYGVEVRAYLGYLCELNSFTPVQYVNMLSDSDLALCSQLLLSGALESVKTIIDAYTPTAYFIADMKTGLSAELTKYIALVNAL